MAGDESMKVVVDQAEARQVVPAAHVFSGRGQAGHLAEDFEQAIVVQVHEEGVIFFELPLHWASKEFNVRVREGFQRSSDGDRTSSGGSPCRHDPGSVGSGSCGGGGFEKVAASEVGSHHGLLEASLRNRLLRETTQLLGDLSMRNVALQWQIHWSARSR